MRFLETVTLGEAVIFVGGLLIVAGMLHKIWPFIRKLVDLVDALDALPAQVAKVEQFDDAVTDLTEQVKTIHHEVTPNSGGSMKDSQRRQEEASRRMEVAIARIEAEQTEQAKDIGGIRSEIRADRARLDKHLDQ